MNPESSSYLITCSHREFLYGSLVDQLSHLKIDIHFYLPSLSLSPALSLSPVAVYSSECEL